MTSPSASSNRLPHSGHRIGSDPARPGGRPTALRLTPSYGHTTKFTHRRIRRTAVMRSLPWRNSARRAAEADISAEAACETLNKAFPRNVTDVATSPGDSARRSAAACAVSPAAMESWPGSLLVRAQSPAFPGICPLSARA
jgi:hypothetical protein